MLPASRCNVTALESVARRSPDGRSVAIKPRERKTREKCLHPSFAWGARSGLVRSLCFYWAACSLRALPVRHGRPLVRLVPGLASHGERGLASAGETGD
ncbi:hypothetical protein BaRGS_00025962 [Batillaria attramentaria]|uniref:Uncharacterized protein n=1 Tax=Batillaria attramentaria TaxID=370345 RepID=A0ABD0K618_9CAEN